MRRIGMGIYLPYPQVSSSPPATTVTLFGGQAPGVGLTADPTSYTLGVEFVFSAAGGQVTAVKFYSPATAGVLPQTIALYAVTGQQLIASQAAAWDGAPGSGWVRSPFSVPPALTQGAHYKACVLQQTAASWYGHTASYWTGAGPGGAGITSGPLSAPPSLGSAQGQDTFTASAVLAYPANEFQAPNYWVDVEVTY